MRVLTFFYYFFICIDLLFLCGIAYLGYNILYIEDEIKSSNVSSKIGDIEELIARLEHQFDGTEQNTLVDDTFFIGGENQKLDLKFYNKNYYMENFKKDPYEIHSETLCSNKKIYYRGGIDSSYYVLHDNENGYLWLTYSRSILELETNKELSGYFGPEILVIKKIDGKWQVIDLKYTMWEQNFFEFLVKE